jgi:WD40 repeat protein
MLALGSRDGELKFVNAGTAVQRWTVPAPGEASQTMYSTDISPNGGYVASACENLSQVSLWDCSTGALYNTVPTASGSPARDEPMGPGDLIAVAFSRERKQAGGGLTHNSASACSTRRSWMLPQAGWNRHAGSRGTQVLPPRPPHVSVHRR